MTQEDRNTERFYAFERAARAHFEPKDAPLLGMLECRALVDAAFEYAGRQPEAPVRMDVGFGRTTGACSFEYATEPPWGLLAIVIALPEPRRRPWCALHEAAHALTPGDGHGPQFAALTMRLWRDIGGWDGDRLAALAWEHDVCLWAEVTLSLR